MWDDAARRRIYRLAAMMAAAIAFAGCGGRSPRATARQYIDDLRQLDYAGCYRLLSKQDRAERDPREFLAEIPLAPDVSPLWFRPVLHDTHYRLGQTHRDAGSETAFVPVRITGPDLAEWERTLDAAAPAGGSGAENARRSLDTGAYPKKTWDDRIYLVKERHHWHVRAGFAARDRLIESHRAALVDFHEGRFDKAIADYKSLIAELERLPATGSLGLAERYKTELAEVEKVKAEAPAENAYASKLKLTGVAMKMSEDRAPGIFGRIVNDGDRAVDDVILAVTWYEKRGSDIKPAYREEHPVVLTPIEFTDFNDQVVPFAPGQTRRFGFILTAPAEIQRQAAPYVTIASVAFTQIPAPLPKSAERTVRKDGKPPVTTAGAKTPSDARSAPRGVTMKAEASASGTSAGENR